MKAKEAAKRLGIHETTLTEWCRKGRVPGAQLLKAHSFSFWEIPEESLDKIQQPQRGVPKGLTRSMIRAKLEELLKTKGSMTTRGYADQVGCNVPLVRAHLKRLGAEYIPSTGRWMTPEQVKAKAQAAETTCRPRQPWTGWKRPAHIPLY